jgi:ribose transport system ATP-binding protein
VNAFADVALRVHGLGVHYPRAASWALDGVDLELRRGAVHALVGENGAGKSTLLHVLAGAVPASRGTLTLHGQPYAPRDPADARRRGVALIHQELALAPHLCVEANVVLGAEPTRTGLLARARARAIAREAFTLLGDTSVPLQARVRDLDPAARQLVEIARALASGAGVLLLDEPTSSLSRAQAEPLLALVRRLAAQGKALLYICHALDEVRQVASTCTVLRDGRVAACAPLAQLDDARIVAAMLGNEAIAVRQRPLRTRGAAVLHVAGLYAPGVHDVTFTLHRGEVLGIAGLVGAGRTELLHALFGLAPVRRGKIRAGVCTERGNVGARWRAGMGFVSEDRARQGLALRAAVSDNVTWPALRSVSLGPFVSARRAARATQALVARLGIRCASPAQVTATLSGGNQQKVALARLLHAGCDVLLLDEPTRGIDVGAKAEIYRLVDELVAGAGGRAPAAVVWVSSDPRELLAVCDRIAVIRHGRLREAQPAADLDVPRLMAMAMGAEVVAREADA